MAEPSANTAGGDLGAKQAGVVTNAWQKATSAAKGLAGNGLEKLKSGASLASPALKTLAGASAIVGNALQTSSGAVGAFGAAVGGAAMSGAAKLSGELAKLGPEGEAAGIAIQAMAAAFAATIGTLTTLMGLAIEVTQHIDLMKARFEALAGSASGGAAVTAEVNKLANALPFAKAQVESWAQSLVAAGVKGKQLEDDIKAIASATALMGDSGGAAAETLFKRLGEGGPAADSLVKELQKGSRRADKMLKEMGLSIADLGGKAALSKMNAEQLHAALAKALSKKGKGPLDDLALTFPVLLQKVREGFLSLFDKLGNSVKPFMKAIKSLFAEFSKGGGVINALKPIVTSVLSTAFAWATKAVDAIHGIVKWLLNSGKASGYFAGALGVLKSGWKALVAIFGVVRDALKPIVGVLKEIFSNATVLDGIKTIFKVIAAVIVVVAVVLGTLAAAFATLIGIVGAVVGAIAGAVAALASFAGEAVSAGADFVSGLIGGITGGAGALIDAVKGLASSALGAFKATLGIASPSKVMMAMGGHVAAGAAEGIDRGAPHVADRAANMGKAIAGAAAGGAKGGAPGGKGAAGLSIGELHLHVADAGHPAAWAEEAFAAFTERLAASQGL